MARDRTSESSAPSTLDDLSLAGMKALYALILRRKRVCMSQASMATGQGIRALLAERRALEERGLIRPVPGQSSIGDAHIVYEAAR